MSHYTTEECIESHIAEIEREARAVCDEINAAYDSEAARAGAGAIAKVTAEDLDERADMLLDLMTYQSQQDKFRAIARAIRKHYCIR